MDPLLQVLLQRQMEGQQQPTQPQAVPPSGGSGSPPPEAQRFLNAQKIQDAMRGGWAPNPVLLQASMKR